MPLGAPKRGGNLSFTEHFMELNRCTIAEFRRMIKDLDFDVVDIDLNAVRNMNFLKKIPFFNRFFIRSVHAVLSKVDPCPTVPEALQGPVSVARTFLHSERGNVAPWL